VVGVEGKGAVARKRATLLHVLSDPRARPGIVYCGTRKDTDEVAELIAERGIATVAYHAGLGSERRRAAQERFMAGEAEVVVATNAFGMGIDKADVRTVAHWAVPTSLEGYYQEAGRGGRDGLPARALLLASRMDLGRLIRFNTERQTTVADVRGYVGALRRHAEDGAVTIAPGWSNGFASPAPLDVDQQALSDESSPTRSDLSGSAPPRPFGPLGERERMLLSIAERAGAVELEPGARGFLRVKLTGRGDPRRAYDAIKVARDRGWDAYWAVKRFISNGEECRRRQILDHFGDALPGAPTGRCCSVCHPDEALIRAAATAPATPRSAGRARSSAIGVAGRSEPISTIVDADSIDPPDPVDEAQFERLKAWRLARAEGKPAYTVATNAALEEALRRRPAGMDTLIAIRGIGPAFCEKHGESLLEALAGL
jgi:ATP-dependent DNA helicase RecQ